MPVTPEPTSTSTGADDEDRSWRPGWLVAAPFLGSPPPLTRRQWNVIGLIAIVTMFDQYDLALFSLALKQIQAELLIPEARLGELGAIVRLGALPALFFSILADRLGRRRVLLATIVGYTVLTGATAFAPNAETFVVLQFLARIFAVAEVLLAYVVIAEELDAEHRGWGIGALGALGACGNGMGLLAFSLVDVLPMGWRSLYLIGLGPLLLIAWLRRSLPETRRFEAHATQRSSSSLLRDALQPLLDLMRVYPGRFAAIGAVVFLLGFSENAAGFFGPKYFQEAHGFSPAQFAMVGFFGGFLGIFGSTIAGRLSDRRGRRRIAILFLALHPVFVVGYYQAPFGWLAAPLWVGAVFTGIGGGIVLGTFGSELFPTSYRSTSSGSRMVLATIGGVLGLAAESALYVLVGSHWTAISLLALLAFFGPLIVWLFFPETSGRSLEEISPE